MCELDKHNRLLLIFMLIRGIKNKIIMILIALLFVFAFNTCKPALAASVYQGKIAVLGDAYAKQFEQNIGYNRFDFYFYNGNSIFEKENVKQTFDVMEHYTYSTFVIGAEPYLLSIDKNVIYQYIKNYIEVAKNNGNFVFLSTYMDFKDSRIEGNLTKSTDVDDILKKLSDEYANVFYIDMKNFSNNGTLLYDRMSYNSIYHQSLCAKIIYLVDSIDKEFYHKSSEWIEKVNPSVIAVAGDSYAGTFVRLEKDKNYNLLEFAKDGRTIGQNKDLIDASIETIAKYVLISTSVNDFEKQTTLNSFEMNLRRHINHAMINHKVVFLHTYMDYAAARKRTIAIKDYDNILKKLADEYENTLYIDMHDFEKVEFQMSDKRHYDKIFNDVLYEKINTLIKSMA